MAWSYLVAGNWADGYECSEDGADLEGRRVRQTNMDGWRVEQIWMVCEWGSERGNNDEWGRQIGMLGEWSIKVRIVGEWCKQI